MNIFIVNYFAAWKFGIWILKQKINKNLFFFLRIFRTVAALISHKKHYYMRFIQNKSPLFSENFQTFINDESLITTRFSAFLLLAFISIIAIVNLIVFWIQTGSCAYATTNQYFQRWHIWSALGVFELHFDHFLSRSDGNTKTKLFD